MMIWLHRWRCKRCWEIRIPRYRLGKIQELYKNFILLRAAVTWPRVTCKKRPIEQDADMFTCQGGVTRIWARFTLSASVGWRQDKVSEFLLYLWKPALYFWSQNTIQQTFVVQKFKKAFRFWSVAHQPTKASFVLTKTRPYENRITNNSPSRPWDHRAIIHTIKAYSIFLTLWFRELTTKAAKTNKEISKQSKY